jgi:hypothetical protein
MKLILASTSLVLALQTAFAAGEPDKRTPLDRYQGDTQYPLLMCKLTLRLALAKTEGGVQQDDKSDYSGCIAKGKETAKASLDKALRTVKKVKAQEALKSYHVAFVGALEGIRPGNDERKINYEQRQQALEGKVTEAWARFEIEN